MINLKSRPVQAGLFVGFLAAGWTVAGLTGAASWNAVIPILISTSTIGASCAYQAWKEHEDSRTNQIREPLNQIGDYEFEQLLQRNIPPQQNNPPLEIAGLTAASATSLKQRSVIGRTH